MYLITHFLVQFDKDDTDFSSVQIGYYGYDNSQVQAADDSPGTFVFSDLLTENVFFDVSTGYEETIASVAYIKSSSSQASICGIQYYGYKYCTYTWAGANSYTWSYPSSATFQVDFTYKIGNSNIVNDMFCNINSFAYADNAGILAEESVFDLWIILTPLYSCMPSATFTL
jgi:hypothetical protein